MHVKGSIKAPVGSWTVWLLSLFLLAASVLSSWSKPAIPGRSRLFKIFCMSDALLPRTKTLEPPLMPARYKLSQAAVEVYHTCVCHLKDEEQCLGMARGFQSYTSRKAWTLHRQNSPASVRVFLLSSLKSLPPLLTILTFSRSYILATSSTSSLTLLSPSRDTGLEEPWKLVLMLWGIILPLVMMLRNFSCGSEGKESKSMTWREAHRTWLGDSSDAFRRHIIRQWWSL